jgi:serine protease DegQ
LGLDQTVTAGIVSAQGRNDVGIESYEDFIQTDAAINPGNSGGALADLDGRVVGINTAIATESGANAGICFAIPAAAVAPVVNALIERGSIQRTWIGLILVSLNHDDAATLGLSVTAAVAITRLIRGGPAQAAGLQTGDVITEGNGAPIHTVADLSRLVQGTPAGQVIDLSVIRNGREYKAPVTVSERPQNARTIGVQ